MGVDVDETGRHQPARGVDLLPASTEPGADRRYPVTHDADVANDGPATGPVDDGPAPDHQIERRGHCASSRSAGPAPSGGQIAVSKAFRYLSQSSG